MEIVKTFEKFLQDNNILFKKDELNISFSLNGRHFLLLLDPKDVDYYRLTLPKVQVPDNIDRNILNGMLLRLISEFKVGKVIDAGEAGIWFSYEQILRSENINDLTYVFSRSIKILLEMFGKYIKEMSSYLNNKTNEEGKQDLKS